MPGPCFIEEPKREVGIGHGWLGASSPVTSWARVSLSTVWADSQCTRGIDPRDAAASGADFGEIDNRYPEGISSSLLEKSSRMRASAHLILQVKPRLGPQHQGGLR